MTHFLGSLFPGVENSPSALVGIFVGSEIPYPAPMISTLRGPAFVAKTASDGIHLDQWERKRLGALAYFVEAGAGACYLVAHQDTFDRWMEANLWQGEAAARSAAHLLETWTGFPFAQNFDPT
jgi:hypothetical protein